VKTIITYSSSKRPVNDYPERIISPPRPGICCLTHMERIGDLEEEDGVPFAYKRCRSCGFTVRWFPEEAHRAGFRLRPRIPIQGVVTSLRTTQETQDATTARRVGLLRLPVRRKGRREEERLQVARKRAGSGTR